MTQRCARRRSDGLTGVKMNTVWHVYKGRRKYGVCVFVAVVWYLWCSVGGSKSKLRFEVENSIQAGGCRAVKHPNMFGHPIRNIVDDVSLLWTFHFLFDQLLRCKTVTTFSFTEANDRLAKEERTRVSYGHSRGDTARACAGSSVLSAGSAPSCPRKQPSRRRNESTSKGPHIWQHFPSASG